MTVHGGAGAFWNLPRGGEACAYSTGSWVSSAVGLNFVAKRKPLPLPLQWMKPRWSSPWPKSSPTEVPCIKQSVIWHLGWDIPLECINRQQRQRKPQGYIQKTYFIGQNVLHVSTSSQSPFSVFNVLRSLLFWDVTQRGLVVTDVSREPAQACCLKDCLDLEDGTERSSGNVGD